VRPAAGSGSLVVVTGPPGAGKSTVARAVAARFERSVCIDGDAFFAFLANGAIEPWLPEADEQNDTVIQVAAAAAGRYAMGEYVAVYDGIVGPWYLDAFTRAPGLGALHYVMLMPSVETCWARVQGRSEHAFRDESATEHMHRQFSSAPIPARHVLDPPPDEVDDVVDAVVGLMSAGTARYPA
jgi:gluconate kinase